MKIAKYLGIALAAIALNGCENEPMLYEGAPMVWISGDAAQGATADSVVHSFMLDEYTVNTFTFHVQANLVGEPVDYDRTVNLRVVEDSTTNVPSSAYTITKAIIPANSYTGMIEVTVNRTVDTLDLLNENARLTLEVVDSEDLLAGPAESRKYTLVWCDYLVKPESWSMIEWEIGPFSKARYKFIIDFTGYTEFTEFADSYSKTYSFQAECIDKLNAYNADPANAGRVEGWPYLNDNGMPLEIGKNLQY
ncbi:MAG: DUF4843 domain-containing protein [Odoribacter sp.]|nr:DUF4843 domain-containing protein [Odoribacter sp.]